MDAIAAGPATVTAWPDITLGKAVSMSECFKELSADREIPRSRLSVCVMLAAIDVDGFTACGSSFTCTQRFRAGISTLTSTCSSSATAAGHLSTEPSGITARRAGLTQPSPLMSVQRSLEAIASSVLRPSNTTSGKTQFLRTACRVSRPCTVTGPVRCSTSITRCG